eukprot:911947-Amphidinium_carterae.1
MSIWFVFISVFRGKEGSMASNRPPGNSPATASRTWVGGPAFCNKASNFNNFFANHATTTRRQLQHKMNSILFRVDLANDRNQ